MFHEVRVLDNKGKTKKVLSSKFLSNKYWSLFFESVSKTEVPKKPHINVKNKSYKKTKVNY